jgi:hypothetical protein
VDGDAIRQGSARLSRDFGRLDDTLLPASTVKTWLLRLCLALARESRLRAVPPQSKIDTKFEMAFSSINAGGLGVLDHATALRAAGQNDLQLY